MALVVENTRSFSSEPSSESSLSSLDDWACGLLGVAFPSLASSGFGLRDSTSLSEFEERLCGC
ncbi:hypothetical protein E2C01_029294 [Portunus trituberculatus]|uniref:Uncharacterized protein n=1 Tax=Portunus trituberculatus TaxID=210409 RepID=A0A5B7ERI1_PORTR|nr:hypothetical protein [Portunus trituberculatus]